MEPDTPIETSTIDTPVETPVIATETPVVETPVIAPETQVEIPAIALETLQPSPTDHELERLRTANKRRQDLIAKYPGHLLIHLDILDAKIEACRDLGRELAELEKDYEELAADHDLQLACLANSAQTMEDLQRRNAELEVPVKSQQDREKMMEIYNLRDPLQIISDLHSRLETTNLENSQLRSECEHLRQKYADAELNFSRKLVHDMAKPGNIVTFGPGATQRDIDRNCRGCQGMEAKEKLRYIKSELKSEFGSHKTGRSMQKYAFYDEY